MVFFARADCMGAAGQDQLLLLCVCLLFDVSVVHDSSNFKPYRCFPTQKHLKSRHEVGHWIILFTSPPGPKRFHALMPVKAMVLSHGYSSAILCIPRMV